MTKRPGLFPPDVNDTMTRHWLQSPTGAKYYTGWGGENWWVDGAKLPPWAALEAGWTYLGPAPTYEQAQADAADARRFRFLLSMWWKGDALRDFFHTNVEDDRIIAAIDAEMGEDSNA